jgi:hypothetical protein
MILKILSLSLNLLSREERVLSGRGEREHQATLKSLSAPQWWILIVFCTNLLAKWKHQQKKYEKFLSKTTATKILGKERRRKTFRAGNNNKNDDDKTQRERERAKKGRRSMKKYFGTTSTSQISMEIEWERKLRRWKIAMRAKKIWNREQTRWETAVRRSKAWTSFESQGYRMSLSPTSPHILPTLSAGLHKRERDKKGKAMLAGRRANN